MTIPKGLTEQIDALHEYVKSGNATEPVMTWCAIYSISKQYMIQIDITRRDTDVADIVLIEKVYVDNHMFFHYLEDGETDIPIDEIIPALMKLISRHPE